MSGNFATCNPSQYTYEQANKVLGELQEKMREISEGMQFLSVIIETTEKNEQNHPNTTTVPQPYGKNMPKKQKNEENKFINESREQKKQIIESKTQIRQLTECLEKFKNENARLLKENTDLKNKIGKLEEEFLIRQSKENKKINENDQIKKLKEKIEKLEKELKELKEQNKRKNSTKSNPDMLKSIIEKYNLDNMSLRSKLDHLGREKLEFQTEINLLQEKIKRLEEKNDEKKQNSDHDTSESTIPKYHLDDVLLGSHLDHLEIEKIKLQTEIDHHQKELKYLKEKDKKNDEEKQISHRQDIDIEQLKQGEIPNLDWQNIDPNFLFEEIDKTKFYQEKK